MEVAGDSRAFLGGGEATLAFGFPLGAPGALLELGEPLAPLPDAVADDPGAAPDEGAEEQRLGREGVVCDTDRAGVDDEQRRHERADEPARRPRALGVRARK